MASIQSKAWNPQPYVRTAEDDEQDRREREWKTRMNREQIAKFLQRNPSGRVVPLCN
jgi:hypothetical protein